MESTLQLIFIKCTHQCFRSSQECVLEILSQHATNSALPYEGVWEQTNWATFTRNRASPVLWEHFECVLAAPRHLIHGHRLEVVQTKSSKAHTVQTWGPLLQLFNSANLLFLHSCFSQPCQRVNTHWDFNPAVALICRLLQPQTTFKTIQLR